MQSQPVALMLAVGGTLPPERMCAHRAEVAKHFLLEDHPVLKTSGCSKVTPFLCSTSVFRRCLENLDLGNLASLEQTV